jgi:hypothetical protein
MFVNFELELWKNGLNEKGPRAHLSATTVYSDRARPLLPLDRRLLLF